MAAKKGFEMGEDEADVVLTENVSSVVNAAIGEAVPKAIASGESTQSPSTPTQIPQMQSSEPKDVFLIYDPKVLGQTGVRILQFPPDNKMKEILSKSELAMSNGELRLETLELVGGSQSIPVDKLRRALSHPSSAKEIQRITELGALTIMEPELRDLSGVTSENALTIHFTPVKARKLIAASYDVEWLRMCSLHESFPNYGRADISQACIKRINEIEKEKEEARRTAA